MNKDCFKTFPLMQTDRLVLRDFQEMDFEDYVGWHSGDIPYFMMGIHHVKGNIQDFRNLFLKNVPRMIKTKQSIIWCIAERETNRSIGKFEMCGFDMNAQSAQIHYCLSKTERGKGYMIEVVRKIVEWAFTDLDVNRLYTYVWEENISSSNVLLKCGFQLEGVLRENVVNKYTTQGYEINKSADNLIEKKFKNEQIYGILRNDYISIK